MAISIFDLFSIGIGPSSSHTVGPMRAAKLFADTLAATSLLDKTARVTVELFGSLGATGKGHGTPKAIILGLSGQSPESVDVDQLENIISDIRSSQSLLLYAQKPIEFIEKRDLLFSRNRSLPYHSNGMQFIALDEFGQMLDCRIYYSVGGGFVIDEHAATDDRIVEDQTPLAYPFDTGEELLALCEQHNLTISDLMLANEKAWRDEAAIESGIMELWHVMQSCINRGCHTEGILPGGLKVKRRAPDLYRQLMDQDDTDRLQLLDWVSLFALAVNEENAAGGRMVTAPTNGAAGIIPAVLTFYIRFYSDDNNSVDNKRTSENKVDGEKALDLSSIKAISQFFLTAAAIGILFKKNASISGAEVGCQGEVGSACSMAAAGLAAVLGGTPAQIENAAEIAMEHNLGLTCDPVGGLVQVPCIERNAMASVKAIHAARMALKGDGTHFVSLDKVIKTMRETGRDMQEKYKETSRGGLATHVMEVPVNIIEC
jgi:L-serine dehydratase